MTIKAVIFDIGGVLIKDPRKHHFFNKWTWDKTSKLREKFGSGKISIRKFIAEGSKILHMDKKSFIKEYKKAYGKIIPKGSINRLFINIKTPKYILSDTNIIHAKNLRKKLKNTFSASNEVWLSHEIGMRKVNPAPFRFILKKLKIKPKEILFVDNDKEKIDIAKKVGMQTVIFKNPVQLRKNLKKLGVK